MVRLTIPFLTRIVMLSGLLFLCDIAVIQTECRAQEADTQSPAKSSEIRTLTDIAYKPDAQTEYERTRCKLDLYLPAGDKSGFATLVWFHGGGLQNGDKAGEIAATMAKRFAADGIAVASVNYRLSPQAKFPAYIDDAAAAVAYVVKHIGAHGGSGKNVFVSGHSAGGYLTAMVGLDATYLSKYDMQPADIAGYLPISGQMITHATVRGERGISKNQPIIDEAAPAYHADATTAPFLSIAGGKDLPARAEENRYFVAAMQAAGHDDSEYREFADRNHGTIASLLHEPDDAVATVMQEFMMHHSRRVARVDYDMERLVVRKGYDGKQCWVHARAGILPSADSDGEPHVIMTAQPLQITGSDVFYALHSARTDDLGATWSPLREQKVLERKIIDARTEMTICDFTPTWHKATGKLLGTGHTVWYRDNKVMKVRPRSTAYSVYDQEADQWSPWKEVQMPDLPQFHNCGAGSVQRYDLPNGDILLPVYFKIPERTQYSVTVCLCRFDGEELTYVKHGTEMTVDVKRGFVEPSITKSGDRYYLTLRNDEHGYVATSTDGLTFDEPRRWTFDDGEELGNYNTQQHWVTHDDGLFLVYTRKGADNDHVFRHRAPLFMAQVDPDTVTVIRDTEQVVVPERGARLGNFGIVDVSPNETWIVVTEWMQTWGPNYVMPVDNKYGADNSIYVTKIKWATPRADR